MTTKGNGKCITWIRERVAYRGGDCLKWPFTTNPNGYGMLGYMGDHVWAHRIMCKLAHGEAPTPKHEVAHTCGKGNQGCVNPRHLEWKTKRENSLDQTKHGTSRKPWWSHRGKLTKEQVREIRALKGKMTAIKIGEMYPVVAVNTIRTILRGVTHTDNPKIRGFTAEEDAALSAGIDHLGAVAAQLGRTYSSVRARAYRLGLFGV